MSEDVPEHGGREAKSKLKQIKKKQSHENVVGYRECHDPLDVRAC